jgi:hypothetical protein
MSGLEGKMTANEVIKEGLNELIDAIIEQGLLIGKTYIEIACVIAPHVDLLQIWEAI